LNKLKLAYNQCDLSNEAFEKTEPTEEKTFGFLEYPFQKS